MNIAPFEYQLKNMFWMNQIEESVLEKNLKFEYYYNIDFFRFYCTETIKPLFVGIKTLNNNTMI